MYHKFRILRPPWFCTLIIRHCTNCDDLLYSNFSSSHYVLKFMAKYVLQQLLNFWQPCCERVVSHKIASNTASEIFSHTYHQTWWFVNCGHYCSICHILSFYVFLRFLMLGNTLLCTVYQNSWNFRKNLL